MTAFVRFIISAAILCFATPSICTALEEFRYADLVILDATIITMDEEQPSAEALAIKGESIVAVGASERIRNLIGPDTKVLGLRGKAVVPGFNDAHLHPSPLFEELSPLGKVPCGPDYVATIDELVARLKKKAAVTPPGQWVKGSRYEDTKLGRHPTRHDLDRVSTAHPVYVSHSSGHVAAVNSLALALANVDSKTPDPAGGAFDREADGHPNGVLRESAKGIVSSGGPNTPDPTTAEWIDGMLRRFKQYSSVGLTSIQHAGTSPSTLRKYAMVQAQDKRMRISVMLRRQYLDELKEMIAEGGRGDEWLRIGSIKTFHGNSLSGRTCWLYEPYADRPEYFGIPPAASQKTLNRRVLEIHKAGMQACIHSNGDREIDMVLDAYEAALAELPRKNHRHRIEHGSVSSEAILRRFKELGVVLAPHSYIYEHGDKMEAYGEKRWEWMHPNGAAMKMSVPVAGNSDSEVSAAIPMLRIQSMVTRTSKEGKVYGANQRVSVEQAIYAWTMGSAYASFEEEIKGSLTVGKLADFVVLETDPRSVAPSTIKDVEVQLTAVGGRVVYRSENLPIDIDTIGKPEVELAPGQRLVGKLERGPSKENSGIVASRKQENVFWVINDSGDEPRIYAVRRDGTCHLEGKKSDKPGALIAEAKNRDWEDIAVMPDGTIVVCDVGNNSNKRKDLRLYFVREPQASASEAQLLKTVRFRYPDQKKFPAPRSDFNYDCEGVFTLGDTVYLLTKHRSDTATKLYRLNDLSEDKTHELELLDHFEISGQVVAADALPDGSKLAVATYDTLWLFDVKDPDHPLANPIARLPYKAQQVEALCFDGPDRVLFADEATALLYEARVKDFEAYSRE